MRRPKLNLNERETRCPYCHGLLTEKDTVSYPEKFQCPHCNRIEKPIYEEVVTLSQLEKLSENELLAIKTDLEIYYYCMKQIEQIAERYAITNEVGYMSSMNLLNDSIEAFNIIEGKKK